MPRQRGATCNKELLRVGDFFRLPSKKSRSVGRYQVVPDVIPCPCRARAGGWCCRVRWRRCGTSSKQVQECNNSEVNSALFQQGSFDCFHTLNLRRAIRSPLSRVREIFQCHSGGARYSLIRDSCKQQRRNRKRINVHSQFSVASGNAIMRSTSPVESKMRISPERKLARFPA